MVSKILSICFIICLLGDRSMQVYAEENKTDRNSSSISPNTLSTEATTIAYQIPIRDQIGAPILDILRRGLKDAIRAKADLVILDMDTPGGGWV